MNTLRIYIVGVGGQGNVLASKMIGEAALSMGVPVLMSETHGMAQRGAGRFRHLLKVGGPDGLDVLHAERPDDGFHVDAGQRRRARGLRQGRVAAR